MKTENWNGHEIRFVSINDEWWAVAKDVAEALGLKQVTRAIHSLPKDGVTIRDTIGREQNIIAINESDLFDSFLKWKNENKFKRGKRK